MSRVKHAIVSLFALSTIAVLSAACEEETSAKPQVIFTGATKEVGKDCRDSLTNFEVGDFGNPNASPPQASVSVPTGGAFGQGNADVSCSVTPAGADTFNVSATVVLSGATGGLFTIEGQFKTTGDQTASVRMSGKRSANSYRDTDSCVVKYSEQNMGVAAGRVWGVVTCTNAINGADSNRACGIDAQFRFENCVQ
ncbi:MAG: hypothetical protein U0270_19445 [Labilithrix sp.]